jgi:hypothetical protein
MSFKNIHTTPLVPVVFGTGVFFYGSQLRPAINMSARVRVMLAMNLAVMPHVCMSEQIPTLTHMLKGGL